MAPHRLLVIAAIWSLMTLPLASLSPCRADDAASNYRRPANDSDLEYWLQNMVWYHGFSHSEIEAATGLSSEEIDAALARFDIRPDNRPSRSEETLLVLPYPGGRHPRIGFLDGAVRPQRETKISVFPPWSATDYVVLDVPEAIWSNLGLTYLAHTHVPTIWSQQGVELDQLEWTRHDGGHFTCRRRLPNGIEFVTTVVPTPDAVMLEMTLTNGTRATLSDLRVQNCVMLKGARGFEQQTNDNKLMREPYVACHSESSTESKVPPRWIITAWEPCHRAWANHRCPCLHSDPKFPDCAPGETKRLVGRLSFYEGDDIDAALKRIDETGWRNWQPAR